MKTAVNSYRNERLITFAESKMIPGDHYNEGIQPSNQQRWLILFSCKKEEQVKAQKEHLILWKRKKERIYSSIS